MQTLEKLKIKRSSKIYIYVSGLITFLILVILFKIDSLAPFGNKSLAWMDANIQYLDFYSYFHDVLHGNNDIFYTFGKTLGGRNIAVFSYYLSSPFCLLLFFIDPIHFHTFFDLIVAIKLALASFFMAAFLHKRFNSNITSSKQAFIIAMLSLCYGINQYTIAQASNIMWLDGVYLLPLTMLSIYELVYFKCIWKLSIIIFISIVFNWYTAGINCIFSFIIFCIECIIFQLYNTKNLKYYIKLLFCYIYSMTVGLLLSCIIFLPTISALRNGNRGTLDLSLLFNPELYGFFKSFITGFIYGETSSDGVIALFCGTLTLLGILGAICTDRLKKTKRILSFLLIILIFLMIFWKPSFLIFSLFKESTSYWYRYSYICISLLVVIATEYYISQKSFTHVRLIAASVFYSIIIILFTRNWSNHSTVITFLLSLYIFIALISLWNKYPTNKIIQIIFTILVSCDLGYNAHLMIKIYNTNEVNTYKKYSNSEAKQILSLKKYDNDIYRINNTSTRSKNKYGITAFYNDALAYNYWSISGYTSSPDDIQRSFLDHVGYPMCGPNMCIVNTSILGADSILGVKYILSKYPINGLKKITSIGDVGHKNVYLNPYYLPMAFVLDTYQNKIFSGNPFEYQNQLFSSLLGYTVKIYKPIPFVIKSEGNIQKNIPQIYELNIVPDTKHIYYGNIPWNQNMDAYLNVSNKYTIAYSCWLSPSVFYIPTNASDSNPTITLTSKKNYSLNDDAQFYALDLNLLEYATNILKKQKPNKAVIKNGYAKFNISNAKNGQYLFTSIAYDKGWSIKRNGKIIIPSLFAETFYTIPLVEGENDIELIYSLPKLKEGIFLTILGSFGLLFEILFINKKIFKVFNL